MGTQMLLSEETATRAVSVTRVLIADSRHAMRTALQRSLSEASDIEVIGEAAETQELQLVASRLNPDVIVVSLPLLTPLSSLPTVRLEHWSNRTPTLVIMPELQTAYLVLAADIGAVGYLLENANLLEFVAAVRRAAVEQTLWTDEDLASVRRWQKDIGQRWRGLTDRERDVLQLLAKGMDNSAIASAIAVTPRTVEHHVSSILQKLGLVTRLQAAVWFLEGIPPSLRGGAR